MREQWKERNSPARLERRYQFEDYEMLSEFLERAAKLSEKEAFYPDMGFGKDYVNITIYSEENKEKLGQPQHRFAQELDLLIAPIEH